MEIKLEKLSYKNSLKNINYTFEEEKITSIIGSSNSGKSLLGYLISGIENNYTGNLVNTYKGRKIGYVFQNPEEAFIFNTVREELSFGLKKYNYKVEELNKRIEDSLKMVELPISYLDKSPFELSSGEKKLIAIATVLSLNPSLIILDEPTLGLDNEKEEKLIRLLKKMKTRYHKTIIIISSDIKFVLKLIDNYLILKKGKIVSTGTKKDLLNNIEKIKGAGIEIPPIIDFINTVKKKKNINLELTFDIKELMKDIYRNAG